MLLVVHDSCLYWYGAPVELLLNVNVVLGAVPDVLVYVFLIYYTPAGDLLSTSAFSPGVLVTTLLLVVVVVYVFVV